DGARAARRCRAAEGSSQRPPGDHGGRRFGEVRRFGRHPGRRLPTACLSAEWSAEMAKHRIAVIPGVGLGKEVVPEGIRVLDAAAAKYGIELEWEHFPWSCEWYRKHGQMMPADGISELRKHDAIRLGEQGIPCV